MYLYAIYVEIFTRRKFVPILPMHATGEIFSMKFFIEQWKFWHAEFFSTCRRVYSLTQSADFQSLSFFFSIFNLPCPNLDVAARSCKVLINRAVTSCHYGGQQQLPSYLATSLDQRNQEVRGIHQAWRENKDQDRKVFKQEWNQCTSKALLER